MKPFNDFAENTKNDFYLIAFGIGAVAVTTLLKPVVGGFISGGLRIIAAVLLGYATYLFAGHIKDFFVTNPDFITDPAHSLYRRNIYAGCGLCVLLVALVVYAIVSNFL